MMGIIMVYGVVMMIQDWQEDGFYVMGEVLVNTHIPFDNFANLTTWSVSYTHLTLPTKA